MVMNQYVESVKAHLKAVVRAVRSREILAPFVALYMKNITKRCSQRNL